MVAGLNRDFCSKSAVYGSGVYTSLSASYSASDDYSPPAEMRQNTKRIFAGRIAVRNCEKGMGLKRCPEGVDTLVDTMPNPTMFIAQHDCQVSELGFECKCESVER